MASIVQKKNSFCVVYTYKDETGKSKQKWETYRKKEDAERRKKEVEYSKELTGFVIARCNTVNELLNEYIETYGKNKWALSTFQGNVATIDHYIRPMLGEMNLKDLNTHIMEKFYHNLLKTKAVQKPSHTRRRKTTATKQAKMVSASTVRDVHKLLHSCFEQAVKWDIMEKNPCTRATLPKYQEKKREIWTADILFQALEFCEDERLALAMQLAFSCSLRIGELLGLTWDCVNIKPASIENGNAYIYIDKEIQRVNRSVLESLNNKDIIKVFPASNPQTTTLLVLKTPKTESSVRKIFLPKTVAELLLEWKKKQNETKEMLGGDYMDYNLVLAGPLGLPTEPASIRKSMNKLIEDNDLPPVVFHSLRHTSITYKLKLNGGNIKAVQGDSGHSQAQMVTEQYSHILDEDRVRNAQLMESAFYSKNKPVETAPADNITENTDGPAADFDGAGTLPEGVDTELLKKLLEHPELISLLGALAKK